MLGVDRKSGINVVDIGLVGGWKIADGVPGIAGQVSEG